MTGQVGVGGSNGSVQPTVANNAYSPEHCGDHAQQMCLPAASPACFQELSTEVAVKELTFLSALCQVLFCACSLKPYSTGLG